MAFFATATAIFSKIGSLHRFLRKTPIFTQKVEIDPSFWPEFQFCLIFWPAKFIKYNLMKFLSELFW
jgi:hypothetical protein